MVSETVPIATDGNKEPLINSTRILNITAADQADTMYLIINAKLKQNSEWSTMSNRALHPQEDSSERHTRSISIDKESGRVCFVQETMKSRSGNIKCSSSVQMRYFKLFWKACIPHEGGVTPLHWTKETGVQMAQKK